MINTIILILLSLVFVLLIWISWICYKLFIANSTSSDDLATLEDIKEQQGRLSVTFENLIKPITKTGEDVIAFKDPMSKISRYLSGGTRAGTFGEWGAEAILRDTLPEHLIDTNVEIKSGSGDISNNLILATFANPALDIETASTERTARNQKYSGEVSNISKPFIVGIKFFSNRN